MKKNKIYGVILAGGAGERLWPISRRVFPKYLLCIKEHSLLKEAFIRMRSVCDEIMVVTTHDQRELVKAALHGDRFRLIEEPRSRNTLAAVCLAAFHIKDTDPDAIMVVAPADHIIRDNAEFKKTVKIAIDSAMHTNSLVTIGVKPTYPATSFGYIEVGRSRKGITYPVKRFIEKPAAEDAATFIKTKRFYWNSGIFAWKTRVMLNACALCQPELSFEFEIAASVKEIYERVKPLSIDYGIMEKSKNITLVPAHFKWNDMGIWMSLEDISLKDSHGNISMGASKLIDTKDSIVVSNDDGLVGAIGISGLIIVRTKDATLVCTKKYAERVRDLVRIIKEDPKLKKYA